MENNALTLTQFHTALGEATPETLFQQWAEELHLRQLLRRAGDERYMLPLASVEDFRFYKRALYDVGLTEPFFALLLNHLPQVSWPEMLAGEEEALAQGFLAALERHLAAHTPNLEELKALIRLYSPGYSDAFAQIFARLSEKDLKYLLDKTSNFALHSLLQEALDQAQHENAWLKNLFAAIPAEKQAFRAGAAGELEQALAARTRPDFSPEFFKKLLIAGEVETVFRLLQFLQAAGDADPALVTAVAPLYALLTHPENAFLTAQQIFRQFYPEQKAPPVSFSYLHLYQLAARFLTYPDHPFRREFALKLKPILAARPDDALALCAQPEFPQTVPEESARRLLTESRNRLENAPHEAWTLLEILYVLLAANVSAYSTDFLEELLRFCLFFYQWLPARHLLPPPTLLPVLSDLAGTAVFKEIAAAAQAL